MSEGWGVLPAPVLQGLADKVYEKRKKAAHEVEVEVRRLVEEGSQDKVDAIILLLKDRFTASAQINQKKGGLIGLAAVTVGLGEKASEHLKDIVPLVLKSFSDTDSRVRYYACEALYNIAKVTNGDFIDFFNDVFDALCKMSADPDTEVQKAAQLLNRLIQDIVTGSDEFSVEEFIPLLQERMSVVNQKVQQFLVGWIKVLDSVPDIDMLSFLPDFLDGLFSMLGDSSHEIRGQADSVLRAFLEEVKQAPQTVDYGRMTEILVQRASGGDEFTRLTAITWINEFVKLGGLQLMPYYAAILGAVLPCIADGEEKIQAVAEETSVEQMRLALEEECLDEGFDIASVLEVMRRELGSEWDSTRLAALSWIKCLLQRYPEQVLDHLYNSDSELLPTIFSALNDPSNEVVVMALDVQASIALHPDRFHDLILMLLLRFRSHRDLLERRGSVVVRHLASMLEPERVFREMATILLNESDCDFAATMIQALNLILVAAPELRDVRDRLKRASPSTTPGAALDGSCSSIANGASFTSSSGPGPGPGPGVPGDAMPPPVGFPAPSLGAGAGPRGDSSHTHAQMQVQTQLQAQPSSHKGGSGRSLFLALFPAWCHSPVSAVTLCLLAQAFELASAIVSGLDEGDMTVSLMVQMDKLVHLLETPVFSFLRLRLLDPRRSSALIQTLYSMLMLLPQQSLAFKVLRTRLKCVPALPAPPVPHFTPALHSAFPPWVAPSRQPSASLHVPDLPVSASASSSSAPALSPRPNQATTGGVPSSAAGEEGTSAGAAALAGAGSGAPGPAAVGANKVVHLNATSGDVSAAPGTNNGVAEARSTSLAASTSSTSRQLLLEEVVRAGGHPVRASGPLLLGHGSGAVGGSGAGHGSDRELQAEEGDLGFQSRLLRQYVDIQRRQRLFRDPSSSIRDGSSRRALGQGFDLGQAHGLSSGYPEDYHFQLQSTPHLHHQTLGQGLGLGQAPVQAVQPGVAAPSNGILAADAAVHSAGNDATSGPTGQGATAFSLPAL